MHAQYKVPGGKMVVVDLDVVDERLANVSVAGDFFLEPDSALDNINAALTGMPASSTVSQMATAITAGLPEPVEMLGFSAESVAIAVRRALGKATSWFDHTFDVIDLSSMDPAMHVALDEVITQEVTDGVRNPTLRFWEWDSPLVVIGSYQSVRNEIDMDGAERHGINVVRRASGGGAMFMEPGNCITYSLSVPGTLVDGLSFEQSYAFLDDWVMGALSELGIKARYVPINDIASDQGKIAGAAQRRFAHGGLVHHVTMAYDIDADKMLEVLRIGREKLSDKGTKSANKRVDPMRSQTGLPREEIVQRFIAHFMGRYDAQLSAYTPAELDAAKRLVDTKYKTDEWLYRVP